MTDSSNHSRPHNHKDKSSNAASHGDSCSLCGLSLRHGKVTAVFSAKTYEFCCMGCRQVFNILIEATESDDTATFRETELFKKCLEAGIIPKSEAELALTTSRNESSEIVSSAGTFTAGNDNPEPVSSEEILSLNLKISNMWCPACAWLIDASLKKTDGIVESRCDFSTDRLRVAYNPVRTSPAQIIDSVSRLGYRARIPDASQETREKQKEFIRFAICAFLTMNIMMLSWALYSGFFTEFTPETIYKLSWPAFLMASIVLAYGGAEFFKKAWTGLINAAFGMETLIIMGSFSAYIYSAINLFTGSIHVYFDTAAMLITLVLLGKALERRAKHRVLEDLEFLFSLTPTKVRICNDDFPDGRFVSAGQLAAGDIFLVNETEIVPADGSIVAGSGSVDESSLTGEPLPIAKRTGETIRSGVKIIQGTFQIRADKVGAASTLGQMIEIIEKTLLSKVPLEGKTDAILQWFVPAIIALSAGTALFGIIAGLSTEASIIRAVTVMVISCPCALGIAIPLARIAGISIAGRKGILIRDFRAFEQAVKIDRFVFDKTGTVTEGRWNLLDIVVMGSMSADRALALAAGLEQNSAHFIALEILSRAKRKGLSALEVENIESDEKGLKGELDGRPVKIGSADFLAAEHGAEVSGQLEHLTQEQNVNSYVYLGIDGKLGAVFIFGDALRSGSRALINMLHESEYEVALISGDGDRTTKAVAKQLGIETAHGGQLPQDKAAFVRAWQKQNRRVAMIGDGINDAPALVQADLSIAVHAGGQLSKEMADITLMRAEPDQVADFLKFAERVNKKIHQNLVFTFLYNVICIPVAMSGLLNPLLAVTAMLLSSLSVIGNTLLLVKRSASAERRAHSA
jgi:heavy metal translocating P-type ATPase